VCVCVFLYDVPRLKGQQILRGPFFFVLFAKQIVPRTVSAAWEYNKNAVLKFWIRPTCFFIRRRVFMSGIFETHMPS
jgi:hypothetical protein